MIIGFSRYGSGASGPALDYLTGYLTNGEARDPKPEVVRGNPNAVAEIIDALPFERRYSSGVLSFAVEDRVTPEIQEDIMNRFESAVFAGLPSDRRSIVWIKHGDKGRTELHFVVPRVDLGTGKSLNIAPPTPASRHLLDTLRDCINRRYAFRDPHDPACARGVSLPAHIAKLAAQAKRLGHSPKKDFRQAVTEQLEHQAFAGTISNRADVVKFLKNQGFIVPREGINYLTIVRPDTGERVRLKGNIFREHFCPRDLQRAPTRSDLAQLLVLDKRLERLVEKRANYNRARYGVEKQTEALQIKEELPDDRTRKSLAHNRSEFGEVPSRTRAPIYDDALRLNEATQRFRSASDDLEFASDRFGRAHRAFANDFDQKIATCENRQASDNIMAKYDVPEKSTADTRELDQEREPDEDREPDETDEPEMDADS